MRLKVIFLLCITAVFVMVSGTFLGQWLRGPFFIPLIIMLLLLNMALLVSLDTDKERSARLFLTKSKNSEELSFEIISFLIF